jgi:SPP1 family phage portal protein
LLTESEILKFIQNDVGSTKKQYAKIGVNYYEGEHDIKNYKLYYYNGDGVLVEDKTRSNIKISHPFFTELVDQEVQYMLSGGEAYVKSDTPELQAELDEYFNENEDFTSELYEVLTGCIVKGYEYMYAYKNSADKLAFQCADSMGVIEVDAKYSSDNKNYYIYWYIEKINSDNKTVKKIQVWDDNQTYFYTQIDGGALEVDEGIINPRPHVLYKKDNDDNTYYEGLGYVPFFRLDNCKKQISGLKTVKEIIDDYDLISCGLSNNLQDASEYLVVVRGFQGDNLEELMQNVKVQKHIGVPGGKDEAGGVDFKTVDVPYEARKTKLELDESNIYKFGFGLNTAGLRDTSATTNIAIKAAYSLLDLKVNKLEIRLKQFLRKILKVVLEEINTANGTDYQQKDVYFNFVREIPTNAQENAQIKLTEAQTKQTEINTLLNLAATLDNETIMQNVCGVLDIDYEQIKGKLPLDDAETDIMDAENSLKAELEDGKTP